MKIIITENQMRLLTNSLLNESIAENIYKKRYQKHNVPEELYFKLINVDPLMRNKEGQLTQPAKMMLNMFIDIPLQQYKHFDFSDKNYLRILDEDLPKAEYYIKLYNKHKNTFKGVDITSFKYLPELFKLISKYTDRGNFTLNWVLSELDKSEYHKIYEDSNWVIFTPETEKASCYLGFNTEWCTTYGKHSLNKEFKEKTNRFDDYINAGTLYVIINKNDENEKYQFHISQFKDENDRDVKRKDFFEKNPQFIDIFKLIINKEIKKYIQKPKPVPLDLSSMPITALPDDLVSVHDILDLRDTEITSLGGLKYVSRYLFLNNTPIETLGELNYVGMSLYLNNSKIRDLGKLRDVEEDLYLIGTPITDLGGFGYSGDLGGSIYIEDSELAKKYSMDELKKLYPKFKHSFEL